MAKFSLTEDDLDKLEVARKRFETFVFEQKFASVQGENLTRMELYELRKELLKLGVNPEQMEIPTSNFHILRNMTNFRLNLGRGFCFKISRENGQTLIGWEKHDLACSESRTYNTEWYSHSFRMTLPGIYRLSEKQMAYFLTDFVNNYDQDVRQAFDRMVFERQKRLKKKELSRAAIYSLVAARFGPLHLEYSLTEQCYRMKVTVKLSDFNQLCFYVGYKNFMESLDRQIPAIEKLREGLQMLSAQSRLQYYDRYLPWVKSEVNADEEVTDMDLEENEMDLEECFK